jgi:hypothetical protein
LRPTTPLSFLEQLWAFFVSAIGSEEVLVFALLAVFAVACLMAVLWFAEVLGGDDDAAA